MDGFTALDQLVDIIASGVADIKRAYVAAGAAAPRIDQPWAPTSIEQEMSAHAVLVSAAAFQLASTLGNPNTLMWEATSGLASQAAGICTVTKLHIPELVHEAGAEGVSAEKLGETTNVSAPKLARILRQLASRHVFREVTPGVFTHNRLSSVLNSGVPYASIVASPLSKYNGTTSISSMVEFDAEVVKGAAFLPVYMATPSWSFSEDAGHAPMCIVNQPGIAVPLPFFEYFNQPGQEMVHAAFDAGMAAHSKALPARSMLDGFDWGKLPPDSLIIDVGGGIGSVTLALVRKHPNFRYIVQDLPATMEDAHKYWMREDPASLVSGRVELQPQSFFEAQPAHASPVAVYVLRYITHDWSTSRCQTILRQLATAATLSTRVVVLDFVVPYTCNASAPAIGLAAVGTYDSTPPPPPLLPSAGSESIFDVDMAMMILTNSQERTVGDFVAMCQGTEWGIEEVHIGERGRLSHIVFKLVDNVQ